MAKNDALLHTDKDNQIKTNILLFGCCYWKHYKDSGDKTGSGTINALLESMLLTSAEFHHKKSPVAEDYNELKEIKCKKMVKNQSEIGLTLTWLVTKLP